MGERYTVCCDKEECIFCEGTGFGGDADFYPHNIRPSSGNVIANKDWVMSKAIEAFESKRNELNLTRRTDICEDMTKLKFVSLIQDDKVTQIDIEQRREQMQMQESVDTRKHFAVEKKSGGFKEERSWYGQLERLKEPFRPDEVEFRLAQSGVKGNGDIWAQCLAYISARAILDRLDDTFGADQWKVSYDFIATTGVICNLSIKCGDEWVTKQDGAEFTEIESFKGGISSALKRAGSAWGIGRYLYGLESGYATIVDDKTKGALYGKTKTGTAFKWLPPPLPDWALPKKEAKVAVAPKDEMPTLADYGRIVQLASDHKMNDANLDQLVVHISKNKKQSLKSLDLKQLDYLSKFIESGKALEFFNSQKAPWEAAQ